jgi:hypothetical protein
VPANVSGCPASCPTLLPDRLRLADYRWELDGHWRALRVGHPADELEAAFPEARGFGLLSAARPGYANDPGPAEAEADRALQRALDRLGLHYRPACAAAGNRTWKAYGWLVVDPEHAAFDTLTRTFGQFGSLLWERGQPVRLRLRGARPATGAHPDIDWVDPAGRAIPPGNP